MLQNTEIGLLAVCWSAVYQLCVIMRLLHTLLTCNYRVNYAVDLARHCFEKILFTRAKTVVEHNLPYEPNPNTRTVVNVAVRTRSRARRATRRGGARAYIMPVTWQVRPARLSVRRAGTRAMDASTSGGASRAWVCCQCAGCVHFLSMRHPRTELKDVVG